MREPRAGAADARGPDHTFVPRPLDRFEIVSGLVLGREPGAPALPRPQERSTLAAIESAVLRGLLRQPCGVSFSGGRDSSLVLAVATRVARREGLPDPVPITARFPEDAQAEEDAWQELVVRRLGLREWERRSFTHELDVLGPYARRAVRRHGLLWPCNTHFHLPLLEVVPGGALLTGVGGDEVFEAARHQRAWEEARGRGGRRAVRHLAAELAPRWMRRAQQVRRRPVELPWLGDHGRRLATRGLARHAADEPHGWRRGLAYWYSLRYRWVGTESLRQLAAPSDVLIAHPLSDPEVVAAATAQGGVLGPRSRSAALEQLAPSVLPPEVSTRRGKARFDDVFWNRHSRAAVEELDLDGYDDGLVDTAALLSHWRGRPRPHPQSFLLLQALAIDHGPAGEYREGASVPIAGDDRVRYF